MAIQFPARSKPPQPRPAPAPAVTPEQVNAIATALSMQMQEQKRQIDYLQVELDRMTDSREFARQENRRIGRERNNYKAQYNELKIGIEVVVTSCVSAVEETKQAFKYATEVADKNCNEVIAKARALMDAVREAIAADTDLEDQDDPPVTVEQRMEQAKQGVESELIGQKYGANTRPIADSP